MRRDSKFLEFAGKLWPIRHRRFEEMCSLAITGQLGGAQMCELDEHIAACESCREFLGAIAQVSVQAMPLLAEKHGAGPTFVPPQGIRERFLARLASEPSDTENGNTLRTFPMPTGRAHPISLEHHTVRPIGDEEPIPGTSAEIRHSPLVATVGCWDELCNCGNCRVLRGRAQNGAAACATETRASGGGDRASSL